MGGECLHLLCFSFPQFQLSLVKTPYPPNHPQIHPAVLGAQVFLQVQVGEVEGVFLQTQVGEGEGVEVSLPVYLGTLCFQILQTTPLYPEYVAASVGGTVLWFAGVVGLRAQQEI